MIIKHTQLIQAPDEQLVCRVWETQMPYQQHYMAHMDFKAAESKWEQSYKQYPIREWDKDKFIFLAEDGYGKITSHEAAVAFTKKLSQGIYIDPAKVQVANICIQTGQGCGMTCFSEETCNGSKYAVLVSEPKNQNQAIDALAHDFIYSHFYPDIQAKGECEESDNMKVSIKNWLTRKVKDGSISLTPKTN